MAVTGAKIVTNRRIAGLPLGFTGLTDPGYRVFLKTTVSQANIVNIVPGRPSFTQGKLVSEKYSRLSSLVNDNEDADKSGLWDDEKVDNNVPQMNEVYYEDDKNTRKISGNELKERDMRFYSFKVDFLEYRRILNVLLNEVGTKLIGLSINNVEKYFDWSLKNLYSEGFHFFADAASSVSESSSNDVSESQLESSAKQMASQQRELAFVYGLAQRRAQGGVEEESGRGALGGLSKLGAKVKNFEAAAGAAMSKDIGGAIQQAGLASNDRVQAGEFLLYPKIWKGGSFDKSYNLSFKFVSPYGDPDSIFEYVYLPFLMLMAFALPRQVKPDSYKAPMLVRLDSPGYFSCDMGMITSFSFVRGGSQGLWTAGGLPQAIEVTLTVTDMYPALVVSSSIALLRQNIGLSNFLDNMCGLNVMQANIWKNVSASIAAKVSMFSGVTTTAKVKLGDTIENIISRVFNG